MPSFWSYSYSGRRVGPNYSAPSLDDIAISLGRICRYAGACKRFWPVLLHSMVVADLLPKEEKIYGLLHDASESVINDIPRGFKTDQLAEVEHLIQWNIYDSLKVPIPTEHVSKLVKAADEEALAAEVYTVGNPAIQPHFPDRSPNAEALIMKYVAKYSFNDCLQPDGLAVLDFIQAVRLHT